MRHPWEGLCSYRSWPRAAQGSAFWRRKQKSNWPGGSWIRRQWELRSRHAGRVRGQQIVVQRKQSQFQPVADPELVEDVSEVAFDSLLTDIERLRDVLVGASFCNQAHHLKLSCGQAEGLARRGSGLRCGIAQHLDEILHWPPLQPVLSLHDGANTCRKMIDNCIFQDDATGAELQSFQDLPLVDESCQDDGARGRGCAFAGQFAQSVHARHLW